MVVGVVVVVLVVAHVGANRTFDGAVVLHGVGSWCMPVSRDGYFLPQTLHCFFPIYMHERLIENLINYTIIKMACDGGGPWCPRQKKNNRIESAGVWRTI